MPAPASTSHLPASQPAARQRPKSPTRVLAEAEEQWLFTEEELAHTPSIQDGMAPEKERELRAKGINFIRQVGIMLKLPEMTLSSAAVFFHRFLMRNSLLNRPEAKALHHYTLGAVALFVATKVEESCRKMKDIVVACCRVAQKNPNVIVDEQSKDFWKWRDTILLNEDVLLEQLCFDLTVEAPHKLLYQMLKVYGVGDTKRLRNAAWAFVTDSHATQLCLLCSSRNIAAAALYAAARLCDTKLPDTDGRAWWDTQHVRLKDLLKATNYMVANYELTAGKTGPDGGQSIYVGLHTPAGDSSESPDGLLGEEPPWEQTRLKVEQGITTPARPVMESERKLSTSSQGSKRTREGTNGYVKVEVKKEEDHDQKRIRTSPENTTNGAPPADPVLSTLLSTSDASRKDEALALDVPMKDEDEDGSEEGEVEE